jgi:hypothetical protein
MVPMNCQSPGRVVTLPEVLATKPTIEGTVVAVFVSVPVIVIASRHVSKLTLAR